jgi:hypothetical protein
MKIYKKKKKKSGTSNLPLKIRKIVLWKSFHQENCALEILLSGKLYSVNPSIRRKLYTGNPSIRKIVLWESFHQEKLYSGNPSIRKIVLWKSFHQENCTLDILLSGKLYSGNPTTRNIVLM